MPAIPRNLLAWLPDQPEKAGLAAVPGRRTR